MIGFSFRWQICRHCKPPAMLQAMRNRSGGSRQTAGTRAHVAVAAAAPPVSVSAGTRAPLSSVANATMSSSTGRLHRTRNTAIRSESASLLAWACDRRRETRLLGLGLASASLGLGVALVAAVATVLEEGRVKPVASDVLMVSTGKTAVGNSRLESRAPAKERNAVDFATHSEERCELGRHFEKAIRIPQASSAYVQRKPGILRLAHASQQHFNSASRIIPAVRRRVNVSGEVGGRQARSVNTGAHCSGSNSQHSSSLLVFDELGQQVTELNWRERVGTRRGVRLELSDTTTKQQHKLC